MYNCSVSELRRRTAWEPLHVWHLTSPLTASWLATVKDSKTLKREKERIVQDLSVVERYQLVPKCPNLPVKHASLEVNVSCEKAAMRIPGQ